MPLANFAVIQHFALLNHQLTPLFLSHYLNSFLGVKFVMDLTNFACRAIKQKENCLGIVSQLAEASATPTPANLARSIAYLATFSLEFSQGWQHKANTWRKMPAALGDAGCSAIYIRIRLGICVRAVCILVQSATEFYSSIVFCAKNFCLHGK